MSIIKIAGICGSLRKESFNKKLLSEAIRLCPTGATISFLDWSKLPIFNQDNENTPNQAVTDFKKAILAADALLFVVPEYNYSFPGALKNAIDCGSRPYGTSAWTGKPAGIMGASVSKLGSSRAQYQFRQVLQALNMPTVLLSEVMIAEAHKAFDTNGKINEDTQKFIIEHLKALIELTKKQKSTAKL